MDLSKLTAAVLAVTLPLLSIIPSPAAAADTADTAAVAAEQTAAAAEKATEAATEAATAAVTEAATKAAGTTAAGTTPAATGTKAAGTKPAATTVTKAAETKPAATETKAAETKPAATETKAPETKAPETKPATSATVITTTEPVTTTTVTTKPAEKVLEPVFKYFDKNLVNARVNVTMPENATAELLVTFDSPECKAEPYYKADIAAGEKVSFYLEGYDNTDPVNDFRTYKASVKVKGGKYGTEYTYTTDAITVPDPNDHPESGIELNVIVSVDAEMSAKTESIKLEGNTVYVTLHLDGFIKGDVNNDGIVDSNDASMVLEEYASASTGAAGKFGEREKIAGDINADGIIGSDDASAILAYYAAASTGGNPTW